MKTTIAFLLAILGIFGMSKISQAAVFLDGSATGCSNGSSNYQPATRSCAGGMDMVYDNLGDFSANIVPSTVNYMRSGTYVRTTNSNEGSLKASVSGTPGSYTEVSAYPGEEHKVIIGTDLAKLQYNPDPSQGADGNTALSALYYPNPALSISGQYIKVSGVRTYGMLTVVNASEVVAENNDFGGGGPGTRGGTWGQGQTVMIHTSHDVYIRNNKIHHSCRATDGLPGNVNGPAVMGYNFHAIIENNEFYDNWGGDIRLKDTGGQLGRTMVIRNNFFRPSSLYNTYGFGGIAQDGQIANIHVYNNIFYNKVVAVEWDGSALTETAVFNNTFVNCEKDINTWVNPLINVYNNLHYHSQPSQRFYDLQVNPWSNLNSNFNLFYSSATTNWYNLYSSRGSTLSAWQSYSGKDQGSVSKDPSLVNPSGNRPEDFKRTNYAGDVSGSQYGNVAGAYETGNEQIGADWSVQADITPPSNPSGLSVQ